MNDNGKIIFYAQYVFFVKTVLSCFLACFSVFNLKSYTFSRWGCFYRLILLVFVNFMVFL